MDILKPLNLELENPLFDIKNSRENIIKFAGEAQNYSSLNIRCIVRRADDDAHDRAIHQWFIQERHKGTRISGVLVMEKQGCYTNSFIQVNLMMTSR